MNVLQDPNVEFNLWKFETKHKQRLLQV